MYSNNDLTPKQAQVFDFIKKFLSNKGGSPTYREISRHFGFKSPKAALDHVRALEKKGYVRCHAGRSRGIELLVSESLSTDEAVRIPLLGAIPAGRPEEKTEGEYGMLSIDRVLLGDSVKHRLFALQIDGESMIERGLRDKDWVVADADAVFREGDVVVALIDGENTVKTLAKQSGKYFLKAESSKHPDWVPVREMMIQGVVRAVLRRL